MAFFCYGMKMFGLNGEKGIVSPVGLGSVIGASGYPFALTVTALFVCGLFSSSSYGFVNEKPVAGKKYDEYLYYDAGGTKKFSLQGSEKGVQHHYYFNAGATLDASNGGYNAAVLAHNWNDFSEETAEIFHIGSGKEFVVKSYSGGYGTLNAEEGATLEVVGGNVVLEAGIESTNRMDNTDSSIHMESSGKIVVKAESMWMGNKRTEDRHNVGAISMAGDSNVVDITLEKGFMAENVDMGIALQTQSAGTSAGVKILAKDDITIHASRSDGDPASGYRGAGLYAMAYYAQDSESTAELVSTNGNVEIKAQGYAVYAYGNTPVSLSAANGSILLSSEEKQGIYAKGFFDQNINVVKLSAKQIEVSGTYGIRADNAKICLNNGKDFADNVIVRAQDRGVYLANKADAKIRAGSVVVESEGKYGFSLSSNAIAKVEADSLSANSEGWSIVSMSGAEFFADVSGLAELNASVYAEDARIDVGAAKIVVKDDVRALSDTEENGTGGKISFVAADAFTLKSDVQKQIVESQGSGSVVSINADEAVQPGSVELQGFIHAYDGGAVEIRAGTASTVTGGASVESTNEGDDSAKQGTIRLTLGDGSRWQLADWESEGGLRHDSSVSSLTLTNATIDFSDWSSDAQTDARIYRSLRTDTFEGSGNTLLMHINLAEESEERKLLDQLEITGAAQGTHTAAITIDGAATEKLHSVNWLVRQGEGSQMTLKAPDGGNQFAPNGSLTYWALKFAPQGTDLVDEDAWDKLSEEGVGAGDWYLVRTEAPEDPDHGGSDTPESDQVVNVGSTVAQAISWLSEKNDLRRRLGEVRYGSQAGVWAKVFNRQDRAGGFRHGGFKQKSSGVHVGFDTFASKNEDSAWLVGAAFRYARSEQEGLETANGGDGDMNEYSGKLYATWMHDSGAYADMLVQLGYYDQDIQGITNDRTGTWSVGYGSWGMGASIELGHMLTLRNGADDRRWHNHVFFEPQVELSYFRIDGQHFRLSTGMQVDQEDGEFLTGRLGFVLGKKFSCGTLDDLDRRYFQIGLIGGLTHEFMGEQSVEFTGIEGTKLRVEGHGLGGTSYYYGLTADWQVSDRVRFYAELDREEGEHYTKDYGVNVGFKYSF